MKSSKSNEMKPVFAAYLNMARQNAYVTLVHISKLMGIHEKRTEGELSKFTVITDLTTERRAERVEKIKKLFHKHFPFLIPMINHELSLLNKVEKDEGTNSLKGEQQPMENQIEMADTRLYADILTKALDLLSDLRNEYTHYLPEADPDVRASLHQAALPRLTQCLAESFREVDKRYFSTDKSSRFEELEDEEKKHFMAQGKERIKILLDKAKKDGGVYKLATKKQTLTDTGILFFISLFLHKKYETMLIDSVQLFNKQTTETEKKIIREAFGVYRIRLVKERMESQRSGYALGMDMLNELQKCPKELFDILPCDKQSVFRVKRAKEVEPETEDGNGQSANEALLVRNADRFPYFALQYIDEMGLFKQLRFQVSLGKFRFEFYRKNCIDIEIDNTDSQDKRMRSLQKEINGFGRLNEIEQERRIKYGGWLLTEERKSEKMEEAEQKGLRLEDVLTEPYMTDQYAHYVMNGNRVGLKMLSGNKGEESLLYLPELQTKTVNERIRADSVCLQPDCWLSIYELPALMFHQMLCKDGDKFRTEKIITGYLKAIKDFFRDVCEKKINKENIFPATEWNPDDLYALDKNHKPILTDRARKTLALYINTHYHVTIRANALPGKMIQYLTGLELDDANSRFRKMAKERVDQMLEKTEYRLEMFKKEHKRLFSEWNKVSDEEYTDIRGDKPHSPDIRDNACRDKKYTDIRAGKLAAYLTADFLRFQPFTREQNNKVTGLNYQVLQSTLALYQCPLNKLRALLVGAKLLDQPLPKMDHPFLRNVLSKEPKSISAFYQNYLEEKIVYLKKTQTHIKNNGSYDKSFLHPDKVRWAERSEQFYLDLAKRYLGGPIELPRGLFEPKIKEILRKKYADEKNSETYVKEIADALNQTDKWCNVTYLIALYFRHCVKDSSQPFYKTEPEYGFTRTYTYFNTLIPSNGTSTTAEGNKQNKTDELIQRFCTLEDMDAWTRKNEQGVADVEKWTETYLSDIEKNKPNKHSKNSGVKTGTNKIDIEKNKLNKYRLEYKENEKVLRRYRVQDMLAFLMAKELLLNKMGTRIEIAGKSGCFELNAEQRANIEKCKLNAFLPSNKEEDKGVLSLTLPFYLKLIVKTKEGKKEKVIYQDELKLKNYGEFFQFVYDDRVRTLLPYVIDNSIERQLLDRELEAYDRHRAAIFKQIQTAENVIIESHPEIKDERRENYYYIARTDKAGHATHRLPVKNNFNAMLRVQLGEADNREDSSVIVEIRNAFSHNRYVKYLTLPEQTSLPGLADYLVKYLNEMLKKTKLSEDFLKKK